MNILLGVDDSNSADELVRTVVAQNHTENTNVLVLHVLQPAAPAPPQMAPFYAPELVEERKQALELVERAASSLRAAGFKAESRVQVGDIREGIVDAADAWHADQVIVGGSHGQRGVGRFLLGSVSEFVARHAHCSVEIIRAPLAS